MVQPWAGTGAARRRLSIAVLALACLWPLADLWACLAPPWPDHLTVLLLTMPLPVLVYFPTTMLFPGMTRRGLERIFAVLLLIGVVNIASYLLVNNLCVYELPDRWHRDVGGWEFNERAHIIQEMNPGITLEGILRRSDNRMSEVFTPASLRLSRALLLILWYALAAEISAAAFLLVRISRLQISRLLDQVDNLDAAHPELSQGIRLAVKVAADDPEMALARVRKALDYVVRDVYRQRVHEDAGTRPLENLLKRLEKDGHLRHRLAAYAHAVRELGNVGLHGFDDDVTAADVEASLGQLRPILTWYLGQEVSAPHSKSELPVPGADVPAEIPVRLDEHRASIARLPQGVQDLGRGLLKAVNLAVIDPEMALARCRKVLDRVIRQAYEQSYHEPAGTRPLEVLLQRLTAESHLPAPVAECAARVRDQGNAAAHRFEQVATPADVADALSQLLQVVTWFAEGQACVDSRDRT